MKRLAVVTTHPIQYNAPLFKLVASREHIDIKVFYTWSQSAKGEIFDPGFGIKKGWDIPLLEGYQYHFSNNVSKDPGSHHYSGIKNPNLLTELREYNPDVVLVYGWNFHSHLQVIKSLSSRVRIFFRGDSTLLDMSSIPFIKRIAKKVILKWVYSHIDKALFTGTHNKKYFIEYGLSDNKLSFMPHAVDNDRFSSATANETIALRAQLGISDTDIVYLFAGKLETKKNPELLIKSFLNLAAPHTKLVVVGNGNLELALKENYDSESSIIFIGFQNQTMMPIIYSMADVFVLPSKGPEETWGLAVNEAMAAGKAVIVSDKCGCNVDIVENDINGYVFESENATELSTVLKQTFDKGKAGIQEMGNNSKRIISNWGFDKAAELLEQLVRKR